MSEQEKYDRQVKEIEETLNGLGTLIHFVVGDYCFAQQVELPENTFLVRGYICINERNLITETHLMKDFVTDPALNWAEYVIDLIAEGIKHKVICPGSE